MVTVEADPVGRGSVGGRAGGLPGLSGSAAGVGVGAATRGPGAGVLRPRRARCASCRVTHVLLPVTVLARRAHSAVLVWAALVARAGGLGHRRIAEPLRVPETTVRGWLRRMAARLDPARAVTCGGGRPGWTSGPGRVELRVAGLPGCGRRGGVGGALPVRDRFARRGDGRAGRARLSGGRLLAPGGRCGRVATRVRPSRGGGDRILTWVRPAGDVPGGVPLEARHPGGHS